MTKGYNVERTVDQLGRIVIPKDMRKMFNIDVGARIVISATTNGVIVKSAENSGKKQPLKG